MAKSPPLADSVAPDLPELTHEQSERLDKIDFEIPRGRELKPAELEGLARESLEAYQYGRRARYDSQGRDWSFFREVDRDAFYLAVSVSIAGLELASGRVELSRVAGKDGENAMIDLTLALHSRGVLVQHAVHKEQLRRRAAAEAHPLAVHGAVELGPQVAPPPEADADAGS